MQALRPPTDAQRAEELLPLVYQDLRRLAAARMAHEAPGQTLQPTELVHEAWLRISRENHPWANRNHFFAAAAEAMRRILIERARRRLRDKHGGRLRRTTLEELDLADTSNDDLLLAVHDALATLEAVDRSSRNRGPTERSRLEGTARFYRAMSLFRQGRPDEARSLFLATETTMKPWSDQAHAPWVDPINVNDLMLWLACREAKALLDSNTGGAPRIQ